MIIKRAVSLGQTLGKTNAFKVGSQVTTAATADQVVATYTVTTNKTFYLQYLSVEVHLTTPSATAAHMGTWSLETPSGTKVLTHTATNPTTSQKYQFRLELAEPIPVASAVVCRVVCTPSGTTSTTWEANFGGYEVG